MKLKVEWNKNFKRNKKKMFSEMQDYIDKECIKRRTPFVPVALPKYENAGKLRDSAKISEPGKIVFTARFAKRDYYAHKNHQRGGNPNAQRLWFEVMKKTDGEAILRGAKAIAKKGGK